MSKGNRRLVLYVLVLTLLLSFQITFGQEKVVSVLVDVDQYSRSNTGANFEAEYLRLFPSQSYSSNASDFVLRYAEHVNKTGNHHIMLFLVYL